MTALIDSSVLLRKLFGEPESLVEWPAIKTAYASRLVPVEVGRGIDRYRLMNRIDDQDVVVLHREFRRLLRSIDVLAPVSMSSGRGFNREGREVGSCGF